MSAHTANVLITAFLIGIVGGGYAALRKDKHDKKKKRKNSKWN